MTGYLRLQRRFFSHWLWDEKRSFSKAEAFLDLLQLAAFVPTKRMISGTLIELDEGELVASVRYLSARWTWGKDKVAGFLKALEKDAMIRRETRQGETVIILCNYKDYNARSDTGPDSDTDRGQTVSRQRPDKVEEGKEFIGRAMERIPTNSPILSSSPSPSSKSQFEDRYPLSQSAEFDRVSREINSCNPRWRKAMTRLELDALQANAGFLFDISDADWNLLKVYMHTLISPDLGKFYQPNGRQKMIEDISDVLSHADRWKSACKRHRIATGLESTAKTA